MKSIHADKALLPTGWADDVRITTEHGRISDVRVDQQPMRDDWQADCVIPGLTNAHSHAFQRALAGRTERRSPGGRDTFWTWRERMYGLANAIDSERLHVIARQAYAEMLCAGYTAVAEFHYLHRSPGGDGVDRNMFKAIRKAADDAGIRLCYVPVLYERAGFGDDGPAPEQARFALDVASFMRHVEGIAAALDDKPKHLLSLGIGAHSIRAVRAESLAVIADWANTHERPMHIHIAEQQREVDQALAFYARRPVRWLLENFEVGENWCLVHATHMDPDEVDAAARSGAVACLCPSTEANLGDGLFALRRFLEQDGRIAIGSDSHISINPYEELRWLEYGQRLTTQRRNVAAVRDSHTGGELFQRALDGGAQALGYKTPGLVAGSAADLVCLYGEDPMLAGHDDSTRLDALVFSGYRFPVERVMVGGRWVVKAGEHRRAGDTRAAFKAAMGALAGQAGS
jgi:formimidoylglutamate deiminase